MLPSLWATAARYANNAWPTTVSKKIWSEGISNLWPNVKKAWSSLSKNWENVSKTLPGQSNIWPHVPKNRKSGSKQWPSHGNTWPSGYANSNAWQYGFTSPNNRPNPYPIGTIAWPPITKIWPDITKVWPETKIQKKTSVKETPPSISRTSFMGTKISHYTLVWFGLPL